MILPAIRLMNWEGTVRISRYRFADFRGRSLRNNSAASEQRENADHSHILTNMLISCFY
jgi:hypothetical protein